MDPFPRSCEIVEATEETECTQHYKGTKPQISGTNVAEKARNIPKLKFENYHSVEEDLNKLFDAIDLRVSRKSASKKPIRVGSSQGGIGISECGTLKQALRGLCISHASEMAAMKRVSKPTGLTRVSDAGTMKKIYASMVVGDSESGSLPDKGKQSLVEVSLVPEMRTSSTLKISKSPQTPRTKSSSQCVSSLLTTSEVSITRTSQKDEIENVPSKDGKDKSLLKSLKLQQKGKFKASLSPLSSSPRRSELELDEVVDASTEIGTQTPSLSRSPSGNTLSKISTKNEHNVKQVFINQNIMKKLKQVSTSSPPRHKTGSKSNDVGLEYNSRNMVNGSHNPNQKKVVKESASPAPGNTSLSVVVSSGNLSKPCPGSNNSNDITFSLKVDESSNSREKGGSSQSSKTSSIAEHSNSTTSTSTESYLSGSCYNVSRPHMSKDLKWRAIHEVEMRNGSIGLKHFKLLKRLGCGDIATVYLAELTGTNYLFALKIMDNEFLSNRLKLPRAQTEKEILQMLDHPFLPTLFAHFTTDKFSCLVMEYCPGGDLHILRQIQPSRTFPEQMARFYLAEVLLAMEYLHMLGVVYRDLKPENILVREDGHIMLSDFDLSLRCTVSPKLLKSSSSTTESKKEFSVPCISASCIDPFCPRPSWVQVPCFSPRLTSTEDKSRKLKSHKEVSVNMLPQLVAEPTSARSNSFVGTHEYLAPEIIKAEGHGNEVDWWTFGIFMYELLLGRTPFKGSGNDETLANIVFQSLRFPDTPFISFQAKDLMTKLLVKEPELRLGSVKGATEIRHHPYFEGLNWALVRCAAPPELPILEDLRVASIDSEEIKFMENFQTIEENLELEVF